MSDQAPNTKDGGKEKGGCCLCCRRGGKSKKPAVENEVVVTNQPGTEQVVFKQPQSNGHRSFTIEDCSYIDEGNETFEEKKWKENGGANITINDVSGVKLDEADSVEGESKRYCYVCTKVVYGDGVAFSYWKCDTSCPSRMTLCDTCHSGAATNSTVIMQHYNHMKKR